MLLLQLSELLYLQCQQYEQDGIYTLKLIYHKNVLHGRRKTMKNTVKLGERGGHGGMDWLVCRAFIESVKNGINTPIDIYDSLTWLAIGPLSEQSIALGGVPVPMPDFTMGKWLHRESPVQTKYCLDEVVIDENTPII
jgi:hypothetical protein